MTCDKINFSHRILDAKTCVMFFTDCFQKDIYYGFAFQKQQITSRKRIHNSEFNIYLPFYDILTVFERYKIKNK